MSKTCIACDTRTSRRRDQAEVAFLNKIEQAHAAPSVFLGDGDDEAKVGFDESLPRRRAVFHLALEAALGTFFELRLFVVGLAGFFAFLDPAGQRDFFFEGQQRHPANFVQVLSHRVVADGAGHVVKVLFFFLGFLGFFFLGLGVFFLVFIEVLNLDVLRLHVQLQVLEGVGALGIEARCFQGGGQGRGDFLGAENARRLAVFEQFLNAGVLVVRLFLNSAARRLGGFGGLGRFLRSARRSGRFGAARCFLRHRFSGRDRLGGALGFGRWALRRGFSAGGGFGGFGNRRLVVVGLAGWGLWCSAPLALGVTGAGSVTEERARR